jgi:hypothetical protein
MVLINSRDAPVGDSVPAIRNGTPGATNRATPTEVLNHPIDFELMIGMGAA